MSSKLEDSDTVAAAKWVLGFASFVSAVVGGYTAYHYGFLFLYGAAAGFFGYALLGLTALKLNEVMWAWAFGAVEGNKAQDRRALFIAFWPFVSVASLTICPIVILVNAVI